MAVPLGKPDLNVSLTKRMWAGSTTSTIVALKRCSKSHLLWRILKKFLKIDVLERLNRTKSSHMPTNSG